MKHTETMEASIPASYQKPFMIQPPTHKSERVFRTYEPALAQIVDNWPTVQIFDPTPYSTETFSCGLRRALASLKEYNWKTSLSHDLLRLPIVVSATIIPTKVVAGPIDGLRRLTPLASKQPISVKIIPIAEQQTVPKINLVDPADDLIQAVIVLHHYRLLTEPSILSFPKWQGVLSPYDWMQQYAAGKDVFIDYDSDTSTYTIT